MSDLTPEADLDQIGYADALAELDRILHELEAGEVDIDLLAARVRRAADLVRHCRGRLDAARTEVTRVVADLDDALVADSSAAVEPASPTGDAPGP